ncbi:hypothetical protein, partial [Escherichia coli]|uniref:hypothetical protein n=1 Tax=Escherichia coli TaxID=562 RepID=UPI002282369C
CSLLAHACGEDAVALNAASAAISSPIFFIVISPSTARLASIDRAAPANPPRSLRHFYSAPR